MDPKAEITHFGPKSAERVAAEKLLKQGTPGDRITRLQAAEAMGIPCHSGSKGDNTMRRAVSYLLDHEGPYWEWDREYQQWKCLTDPEKVEALVRRKHRGTRLHRKTINASSLVSEKQLTDDQRREFQLTQLQCGAAAMVASQEMRKSIVSNGVKPNALRLPDPQKLIELMKNGQKTT